MFQALIHLLLNIASEATGEDKGHTPCKPPGCSSNFDGVIVDNFELTGASMSISIANLSHDTIMIKPTFHDSITFKKVTKIKDMTWNPPDVNKKFTKLEGKTPPYLLVTFTRTADPTKPLFPSPSYEFIIGDPGATHDSGVLYKIPFAQGKKFKVTQGFNGSHSHRKKTRKHAIDIEMPIGTTICACRAGKVVDMVEQFPDTSTIEAETNYIRILHSDGTYGIYAHLTQNGSDVDIGDDVSEGAIIGKSGNTGESSAPHLHFHVAKSDGKVLATIPWKFKDSNGAEISWSVNQDLEHI